MSDDLVKIEPQPRNGKPFQIDFTNRGPQYWYNEQLRFSRTGNPPMLFSWRCPFGAEGEPVLVDGVWYWKRSLHNPRPRVPRRAVRAAGEGNERK